MSSFNQLILLNLGQIDIEFFKHDTYSLTHIQMQNCFQIDVLYSFKKQVLLILILFMLANNSFIYLKNALAALITFDYNWLED